MEQNVVYLLLLDGFADWEAALATSEIRKAGRHSVVVAAPEGAPVRSMGGLRVTPDIALDDVDPSRAAMLILPGGTSWEERESPDVTATLNRFAERDVPIAALCGSTLALARAGLFRGRRHTSNMRGYLERHVPGYGGETNYVDEPAVRDGNLITASGMGGVEFAYEVIGLLDLMPEGDREIWLKIFRDKRVPEGIA